MLKMSKIAFKCSEFIIEDVSDKLPRHRNYPFGANDIVDPTDGKPAVLGQYSERRGGLDGLTRVVVHQTAGSIKDSGFTACRNTAEFFVRDPAWVKKDDVWRWVGNGRGYPGMGYTWFVPYQPEVYGKTPVIYQTNPLPLKTWHTTGWNSFSGGLVFQGLFPEYFSASGTHHQPSQIQMRIFKAFLKEYVLGVLGIEPRNVFGHYHAGKKTCPGYTLSQIIEEWRMTQKLENPDPLFITWENRQAALVLLGEYIGTSGPHCNGVDGIFGWRTRMVVESLEKRFGLPADGVWDDVFGKKVKEHLLNQFSEEELLCKIAELQGQESID
jgi:hypothetical protein